jgi:hypothetical protein
MMGISSAQGRLVKAGRFSKANEVPQLTLLVGASGVIEFFEQGITTLSPN